MIIANDFVEKNNYITLYNPLPSFSSSNWIFTNYSGRTPYKVEGNKVTFTSNSDADTMFGIRYNLTADDLLNLNINKNDLLLIAFNITGNLKYSTSSQHYWRIEWNENTNATSHASSIELTSNGQRQGIFLKAEVDFNNKASLFVAFDQPNLPLGTSFSFANPILLNVSKLLNYGKLTLDNLKSILLDETKLPYFTQYRIFGGVLENKLTTPNLTWKSYGSDTVDASWGLIGGSLPYRNGVIPNHRVYCRTSFKMTKKALTPDVPVTQHTYFSGATSSGGTLWCTSKELNVLNEEHTLSSIVLPKKTTNYYNIIYPSSPGTATKGSIWVSSQHEIAIDLTESGLELLAALSGKDLQKTLDTMPFNNNQLEAPTFYEKNSFVKEVNSGELVESEALCNCLVDRDTASDPFFDSATIKVSTYHYGGSSPSKGELSLEVAQPDSPFTNHYQNLRIHTTGSTDSSTLGFYFANPSYAYGVFLYTIIAKIPVGYTIGWASNSTGSGSSGNWITPRAGTGKFEEYKFLLKCGSSGSFSSTGFFVTWRDAGAPVPDTSWYITAAIASDITDHPEYQHLSFRKDLGARMLPGGVLNTQEFKETGTSKVSIIPNRKLFKGFTFKNLMTDSDYHTFSYNKLHNVGGWGGDAGTIQYFSKGGVNNMPVKEAIKTSAGSGGFFEDSVDKITLLTGHTYVYGAYMRSSQTRSEDNYSLSLNRIKDNYYIPTKGGISLSTDWKMISSCVTVDSSMAGNNYRFRDIIYGDNNLPYSTYWCGEFCYDITDLASTPEFQAIPDKNAWVRQNILPDNNYEFSIGGPLKNLIKITESNQTLPGNEFELGRFKEDSHYTAKLYASGRVKSTNATALCITQNSWSNSPYVKVNFSGPGFSSDLGRGRGEGNGETNGRVICLYNSVKEHKTDISEMRLYNLDTAGWTALFSLLKFDDTKIKAFMDRIPFTDFDITFPYNLL